MVRHNQRCKTCGWSDEIMVEPGHDPFCPCCGLGFTERLWTGRSASVIGDQLPGGAQYIHNLDHRPVWVENKTQLRHEMAIRGLEPKVRHQPGPESDKSKFTQRFI